MARIKIAWSDGRAEQWPSGDQLKPIAKEDGSYSFFRPIEHGEHRNIDYRLKAARYLLERAQTSPYESHAYEWLLSELPQGYKLFEQQTAKAGGEKKRSDVYLFGHPRGSKYRYSGEFGPHVLWLASDPTRNAHNCACIFCTRQIEPRHGRAMQAAAHEAGGMLVDERANDVLQGLFRLGEMLWWGARACIAFSCGGEGVEVRMLDGAAGVVSQQDLMPFLSRTCEDARAKLVGLTWCTFDRRAAHASDGATYSGIYIGAEKIWTGDAVRLKRRVGDVGGEVMVVRYIYDTEDERARLVGDIFLPQTSRTYVSPQGNQPMREVGAWRLVNRQDEEFEVVPEEVAGRFYAEDFGPLVEADVQGRVPSRKFIFEQATALTGVKRPAEEEADSAKRARID